MQIGVCHANTLIIDHKSLPLKNLCEQLHLMQRSQSQRFYCTIFRKSLESNAIFGLIRRSALERTRLIRGFVGSDQILLAQLSLMGKIFEIREELFQRRDHTGTSLKQNPSVFELHRWFDPYGLYRVLPTNLRWGIEYTKILFETPLNSANRIRCLFHVLNWFRRKRKILRRDYIDYKRCKSNLIN